VIVDGVYVSGDEAMEQLRCVVRHYPLWPGDTLSHKLAKACTQAGWIVRDADGNWIPTKYGLLAYEVDVAKRGAKP
jgi:hypothetical protein